MTDAPRRLTRVGAYALCTRTAGLGNAILLSRIAPGATADSDGMWTLPGGGVDFAEDPRHAAIRELEEETGLIGEIVDLAGVDSWAARFVNPTDGLDTDFHGIRIIYRVRIIGGDLRNEVGGSSDLCAWVAREDTDALPLVELARVGIGLAFGTP